MYSKLKKVIAGFERVIIRFDPTALLPFLLYELHVIFLIFILSHREYSIALEYVLVPYSILFTTNYYWIHDQIIKRKIKVILLVLIKK